MKYFIELKGGLDFCVNEDQAEVADKAWQMQKHITLQGQRFGGDQIKGIWSEDVWYEMHPDKKPVVEQPKELPSPLSAVERSKPSVWRDCVMNNRDLLKQGLLPKYTVVEGEIIEKEYYWR